MAVLQGVRPLPRKPHSCEMQPMPTLGGLWITSPILPENLIKSPRIPHIKPRKPHSKGPKFPENLTGVPESFIVSALTCC